MLFFRFSLLDAWQPLMASVAILAPLREKERERDRQTLVAKPSGPGEPGGEIYDDNT